ncbi:uncharacterized protein LOC141595959 isoform X2 [Silene latifolia]|uniref:uncharacterized protein LOC141595959 isoform X2 n=1 Tax=Silene latifolia TaxID=37657 RepID=UPI003D7724AA
MYCSRSWSRRQFLRLRFTNSACKSPQVVSHSIFWGGFQIDWDVVKGFLSERSGELANVCLMAILKGAENIKFYTDKELRSATANFNQHNKIGEGGFGSVYKGPHYTIVE